MNRLNDTVHRVTERVIANSRDGRSNYLDLMQREYIYPDVGDRETPDNWMDAGGKDQLLRAHERTNELLENHWPDHIPADVDARVRETFGIDVKQRPGL